MNSFGRKPLRPGRLFTGLEDLARWLREQPSVWVVATRKPVNKPIACCQVENWSIVFIEWLLEEKNIATVREYDASLIDNEVASSDQEFYQ